MGKGEKDLKKITNLFVVVVLLLSINISSATPMFGIDSVEFGSLGSGRNITFTDPYTMVTRTTWAGTQLDNSGNAYYCVDLRRTIGYPDNTYLDSANESDPKVVCVLSNYYPYNSSPYPGRLVSNDDEASAIQAVLWHYRCGLDISTITDAQIQTRSANIANFIDNNFCLGQVFETCEIGAGIEFDEFVIKTRDELGNPVAINNIQLSIDGGATLSAYVVNTTMPDGQSLPVSVSGGSGNITITAVGNFVIPQGVLYHSYTNSRQLLVLAKPKFGKKQCTADWGALPVELSSFFSIVTANEVKLNWLTSSEINNREFVVERQTKSQWIEIGAVPGNGTTNIEQSYQFIDRGLQAGSYKYRLKQIDYNGNYEYHSLNENILIGVPSDYELKQNYPNPFNPTTTISYSIPTDSRVNLTIYDVSGRVVRELVNEIKVAGYYSVSFNGSQLSSGMYYYRLTAGNITETKKMILIK